MTAAQVALDANTPLDVMSPLRIGRANSSRIGDVAFIALILGKLSPRQRCERGVGVDFTIFMEYGLTHIKMHGGETHAVHAVLDAAVSGSTFDGSAAASSTQPLVEDDVFDAAEQPSTRRLTFQ